MNDSIKKIVTESARLINRAFAPFCKHPKKENDFVPEDKKIISAYNRHRPYGPAQKLCYAPFSNIFFNTDGKAIVCCKNTKVVLGSYPENNIHDLWFSERANLLREYILHHDLSHGCYKCREAILSGNYGSITATGFDFLRAYPKSAYPRMMEFELSNVCNLECAMCSGRVSSAIRKNREKKESLKMHYDKVFTDQLTEFIPHLKQARFYGGEPFLIQIYFDIWEKIILQNPSVNLFVLTNGTILNERIKTLLEKGNFTVNVSVDSFRKETYEKIRVNAVFEETMKNLDYFINYMSRKKRRLALFITPTRLNWQEIPEMIIKCNNWNIEVYFSPAYYPENLSLWNMAEDQLEEIINNYISVKLPKNLNRQRFEELTGNISFWLSEQKKDSNYNRTFLHFADQQESSSKENKTVIKHTDAGLYREMLLANFQNAVSNKDLNLTTEEITVLLSKINALIAKASLHRAVIYYLLKDAAPVAILDRMKSATDEENIELLKLRQQEYINSHNIC